MNNDKVLNTKTTEEKAVNFDEIRPFAAGEMKDALTSLLDDRRFMTMICGFVPLPKGLIKFILRTAFIGIKEPQDFQIRYMKPVVWRVVKKCTDGLTFNFPSRSPRDSRYLFLSNHRDIVLDSAFLDVLLYKHKFDRTVEIGIGDNLLIYPWIKTLVRMNKAFTVRRGLTAHEMIRSSQLMSQYIHYAVNEKGENLWIAQREGRAKDSDDRTQDSVLKMFCMGAPEGSDIITALKHLHITPLTISYEYDPCDYLKAEEFQFKRDVQGWKKSKQDDLDNMKTGILGYKGHVHYEMAPCIDEWLATLSPETPKKELLRMVSEHIDSEIHSRYRLYPGNWIAYDELEGTPGAHSDKYTDADVRRFESYISGQLAKVRVPNPDNKFLRERMMTMYANPVRNYIAATGNK